jgi:hypothetical protein
MGGEDALGSPADLKLLLVGVLPGLGMGCSVLVVGGGRRLPHLLGTQFAPSRDSEWHAQIGAYHIDDGLTMLGVVLGEVRPPRLGGQRPIHSLAATPSWPQSALSFPGQVTRGGRASAPPHPTPATQRPAGPIYAARPLRPIKSLTAPTSAVSSIRTGRDAISYPS